MTKGQKKWTAFLTCVTFTFTLGAASPSTARAAGIPAESGLRLPVDFGALQLPAEIGKIDDIYTGSAPEHVVIIQDAHAIPDAQRSIRKAVLYFYKQYGLSLIALEGASSQLDPRILRSFPDKEMLNKVLGDYFDRGELAGGTAAAISGIKAEDNSAAGTRLYFHGMEDWPVYEKALSLYLAGMKNEKNIFAVLEPLRKDLEQRKKQSYSPDLQKADQALSAFRENQNDFLKTLKTLAALKAPDEGSELALLLAQAERTGETASDITIEVRALSDRLAQFFKTAPSSAENKSLLHEFQSKKQQFQTSQINPETFGLALKELAEKAGLKVQVSDRLAGLVHNESRMRDLEGTRLFSDFDHYAESLKSGFFKNEADRQLDAEDRRLWLASKLARLELSHEDWQEVKQGVDRGAWPVTRGEEGSESSDVRSPAKDLAALFKHHFAFYESALVRDEIFLKNITKLFEEKPQDQRAAVMVAGGFHARGLCRLLREKGISYALVMPQIKKVPEESAYRDQMQGNVSWKNYFQVENGKISLYKAFIRGTRDLLLKKSGEKIGETLKHWRDQIIRDLADEGHVEKAGDYTKFIDEVSGDDRGKAIQERLAEVDRFLEGLKRLDVEGQFNAANIAKLLSPATVPQAASGADALEPAAQLRVITDIGSTISLPALSEVSSKSPLEFPAPTAKSEVRQVATSKAADQTLSDSATETVLESDAVREDVEVRLNNLVAEYSEVSNAFAEYLKKRAAVPRDLTPSFARRTGDLANALRNLTDRLVERRGNGTKLTKNDLAEIESALSEYEKVLSDDDFKVFFDKDTSAANNLKKVVAGVRNAILSELTRIVKNQSPSKGLGIIKDQILEIGKAASKATSTAKPTQNRTPVPRPAPKSSSTANPTATAADEQSFKKFFTGLVPKSYPDWDTTKPNDADIDAFWNNFLKLSDAQKAIFMNRQQWLKNASSTNKLGTDKILKRIGLNSVFRKLMLYAESPDKNDLEKMFADSLMGIWSRQWGAENKFSTTQVDVFNQKLKALSVKDVLTLLDKDVTPANGKNIVNELNKMKTPAAAVPTPAKTPAKATPSPAAPSRFSRIMESVNSLTGPSAEKGIIAGASILLVGALAFAVFSWLAGTAAFWPLSIVAVGAIMFIWDLVRYVRGETPESEKKEGKSAAPTLRGANATLNFLEQYNSSLVKKINNQDSILENDLENNRVPELEDLQQQAENIQELLAAANSKEDTSPSFSPLAIAALLGGIMAGAAVLFGVFLGLKAALFILGLPMALLAATFLTYAGFTSLFKRNLFSYTSLKGLLGIGPLDPQERLAYAQIAEEMLGRLKQVAGYYQTENFKKTPKQVDANYREYKEFQKLMLVVKDMKDAVKAAKEAAENGIAAVQAGKQPLSLRNFWHGGLPLPARALSAKETKAAVEKTKIIDKVIWFMDISAIVGGVIAGLGGLGLLAMLFSAPVTGLVAFGLTIAGIVILLTSAAVQSILESNRPNISSSTASATAKSEVRNTAIENYLGQLSETESYDIPVLQANGTFLIGQQKRSNGVAELARIAYSDLAEMSDAMLQSFAASKGDENDSWVKGIFRQLADASNLPRLTRSGLSTEQLRRTAAAILEMRKLASGGEAAAKKIEVPQMNTESAAVEDYFKGVTDREPPFPVKNADGSYGFMKMGEPVRITMARVFYSALTDLSNDELGRWTQTLDIATNSFLAGLVGNLGISDANLSSGNLKAAVQEVLNARQYVQDKVKSQNKLVEEYLKGVTDREPPFPVKNADGSSGFMKMGEPAKVTMARLFYSELASHADDELGRWIKTLDMGTQFFLAGIAERAGISDVNRSSGNLKSALQEVLNAREFVLKNTTRSEVRLSDVNQAQVWAVQMQMKLQQIVKGWEKGVEVADKDGRILSPRGTAGFLAGFQNFQIPLKGENTVDYANALRVAAQRLNDLIAGYSSVVGVTPGTNREDVVNIIKGIGAIAEYLGNPSAENRNAVRALGVYDSLDEIMAQFTQRMVTDMGTSAGMLRMESLVGNAGKSFDVGKMMGGTAAFGSRAEEAWGRNFGGAAAARIPKFEMPKFEFPKADIFKSMADQSKASLDKLMAALRADFPGDKITAEAMVKWMQGDKFKEQSKNLPIMARLLLNSIVTYQQTVESVIDQKGTRGADGLLPVNTKKSPADLISAAISLRMAASIFAMASQVTDSSGRALNFGGATGLGTRASAYAVKLDAAIYSVRSEVRQAISPEAAAKMVDQAGKGLAQYVVSGKLSEALSRNIVTALEAARREGATPEQMVGTLRSEVRKAVDQLSTGSRMIDPEAVNVLTEMVMSSIKASVQNGQQGGVAVAVVVSPQDGPARLADLVKTLNQFSGTGALGPVLVTGDRMSRQALVKESQRQTTEVQLKTVNNLRQIAAFFANGQNILPQVLNAGTPKMESPEGVGVGLLADLKNPNLQDADAALLAISETVVQIAVSIFLAQQPESADKLDFNNPAVRASLIGKLLSAELIKQLGEVSQGVLQFSDGQLSISRTGLLDMLGALTTAMKARSEVRKAA